MSPTEGERGQDPSVRRIELPDGRVLTVRPGDRRDADGLRALYAGLSDDDTYLRFFSAHRPGPDLIERMVTIGERGGALLVVELEEGTSTSIVADAWYAPLPNGDGEFAITVAKAWRGWLGAYLLDALLEVAAANGVPNLEAEIMLRNRPMMGLVRRRGCVRMADDGSAAHIAIATRGNVPSWPPQTTGPRVLVEGHTGWRAQDAAARRGLQVLVCPGPNARSQGCPVLEGGTCPLVEAADAVVVSLPPGDERMRELVRTHQARHPGLPVVVEALSDAPDVGEDGRIAPAWPDDEIVDLLLGVLARRPERPSAGDDAGSQHSAGQHGAGQHSAGQHGAGQHSAGRSS